MSGLSGLRAPGPVGPSQFPAIEAVAAQSPRLEDQPAPANRRCTLGRESKSRGSPARSSAFVQVRQPGFLLSSLNSCSEQHHLLLLPPVHGSWSPWSAWSDCDVCAGSSTRTRECNSPPRRYGGLPCLGESRQKRSCHDNTTICSGKHNKVLFACEA